MLCLVAFVILAISIKYHCNKLTQRFYAVEDSGRSMYPQGPVGGTRAPEDPMRLYCSTGRTVPAGSATFYRSRAVEGLIRYAPVLSMGTEDLLLGHRITDEHAIRSLLIES